MRSLAQAEREKAASMRNAWTTQAAWMAIIQKYRSCCVYCGTEFHWMTLTKDHILPRSRGGKHEGNIAPACKPCNMAKGNLTPREYAAVLRVRGQSPAFLLPASVWSTP